MLTDAPAALQTDPSNGFQIILTCDNVQRGGLRLPKRVLLIRL